MRAKPLTMKAWLLACCCAVMAPYAFGTLPQTIQQTTVIELGPVMPFKDPNFLTLLKNRAQHYVDSGQWEKRVQAVQARAAQKALRPNGRSFPIALSNTYRVLDTHVNQADLSPWSSALEGFQRVYLFIDGDRLADRRFAKTLTSLKAQQTETHLNAPSDIKVVLTQGDLRLTQEALHVPLYFDQGAYLCRRFSLQHLPALVVLTIDRITVLEPALSDEGVLLDEQLPQNILEALPQKLQNLWTPMAP